MMIIMISLAVIYIKGTIEVGGFSKVLEISSEYDRIEFDVFDLDPTVRHTFWGLVFGGFFGWLSIYGCNQTQVIIIIFIKYHSSFICSVIFSYSFNQSIILKVL